MKPAREPASSRPKPCAFLKKPHESCPFAAPCGPRRKKNVLGLASIGAVSMKKIYEYLSWGGCVCVFSSHPFWTSSSLDVPAGVTQEEGHTGFLIHLPSAVRALIFVARRIQPFLSLVDREVEFCVLTN